MHMSLDAGEEKHAVRILIVEDEKRLARALRQLLSEQGYMTDIAYTGPDGSAMAMTGVYDVILLDVMLPGSDGFSVSSGLRRSGVKTPILMLTARDAVPDKVSGLDSGADDYMTKPFSPEELLARVRALSRRKGEVVFEKLCFGDLEFLLSSSILQCGDRQIRLNYKESEIMKLLLARPEMILSKEEIITKVWGYDSDAGDGNVEAYISFLRRKLSFVKSSVSVVSVKKQGYKLEK